MSDRGSGAAAVEVDVAIVGGGLVIVGVIVGLLSSLANAGSG